ncbi:methylmalonyl-CoA mutase small subunit [Kordiimonas sp. SCSIO 12603]|uniref:methylmalonyl-CoA mutase family protein n=1 Tax=Kordiimonas sp. SCSIO 12603 TaxID=2829596 RepID=UPI0021047982|nr:methylmalonyl-CoA mutase family protein [Kordiimonas sp. SCSIO 12603]UTW57536.1 methylmalonyl-CoA mutase small subunit [Kordiimonas sp. SCSIO 12603]
MTQEGLKLASEFDPASDEAWRALVEKTLKGKDFDRAMISKSYDDINIHALYTKDTMVQGSRPESRQGEWQILAAHSTPDAGKTNQAILDDLERGASALSLKVASGATPGIAVTELGNALEGVYLNMVGFSLVPGEEYSAVSKNFLGLLKKRAYKAEEVKGCLGIDPIGTLAQTGRLLQPMDEALATGVEVAEDYAEYQHVAAFMADSTPYHMAGATEAQEIGLMLSTAVSYLRSMETAGLELSDAAKNIHFTVAADADVYMTVSKIRAARLLWQQVLEACGVKDTKMNITAAGSARMMTVRDPWVNMLRGTTACFAAAVGGADTICIMPHDALIGMSSGFARRIARNIQIVLQEESNLSKVADPAAGAYAFETITSDLSAKAWAYFQSLEAKGGVTPLLASGDLKEELNTAWEKRRINLSKRKDAVTGVSEFPHIHEDTIEEVEAFAEVMADLKPAVCEADPLPNHRLAEDFEALRDRSDAMLQSSGKRAQVFVANLGTPADYTARSTFAKNFFEAGGIEAVQSENIATADDAKTAFEKSGAEFAILCSSDSQYEAMGEAVATALKDAKHVYLAGKPVNGDALKAAGVESFIFMGCNVLATLQNAYDIMGENS